MAVAALATPALPSAEPAPRPQPFSYRPEIDGLRAVAVIVVLLCHAQIKGFSGGFIGVDVFFTISGYVVALSILRSLDRGDFRLRDFYARRLRRLAPSLYLVLAATLVFCAGYCFPQDTYAVLKNSLLASVFYSNIYLAKQTGYFAADADKQALLHTWSLSVEEQFYLVFPLALFRGFIRKPTGSITKPPEARSSTPRAPNNAGVRSLSHHRKTAAWAIWRYRSTPYSGATPTPIT